MHLNTGKLEAEIRDQLETVAADAADAERWGSYPTVDIGDAVQAILDAVAENPIPDNPEIVTYSLHWGYYDQFGTYQIDTFKHLDSVDAAKELAVELDLAAKASVYWIERNETVHYYAKNGN